MHTLASRSLSIQVTKSSRVATARTDLQDQPRCALPSPAELVGTARRVAAEINHRVCIALKPVSPSTLLDEWGNRILQAVDNLAQSLHRSQTRSSSKPQHINPERNRDSNASSLVGRLHETDHNFEEENIATDPNLCHRNKRRRISDPLTDSRNNNSVKVPLPGPTPITGSLSILSWPTFSRSQGLITHIQQIKSARAALSRRHNSDTHALMSASCQTSDLVRLSSCFAKWILPMMPVVEMAQVRRIISRMEEYGVPWNGEACLVFLIAALGCIYQSDTEDCRSQPRDTSHISSTASSRFRTTEASMEITPASLRYWNMARKRLSWAINTAGRLSAQCQLLAGLYLLYNSEPVAAWKMLSGALLSLDEQGASGVPTEETNTKIDDVLDQKIRIAAIMFLSRLRCELDIPFAPISFELALATTLTDQIPIEGSLLNVISQSGTDILGIQGHACVEFQLLRPEASVADLHNFQKSISSMLTALEEWRLRLRFDVDQDSDASLEQRDSHDDSHQGEVEKQMRTLYYETKELILRPSLYLVLHSRHIEGAATGGEEPRSFEELLASHVITQLQAMVSQHRVLLLRRIRLCVGNALDRSRPKLPDVGWLKHQTCFTLTLLLVASSRVQHGVGDNHDIDLVVEQAVNFLAHDGLRSEESGIAADVLRNHQAQRNKPR
ncbi:hypothetical protein FANTH_9254 [Fusarium anthophilum]|uniref:Transcription factor domain-containing protein n=1 Tax=Fusarium anthophilum TaxID=48485 RepID=A0A8H4Z7H1_9HYPO|nr:hypothetical protein FANTH_9254 [Fusarium anthophilum]